MAWSRFLFPFLSSRPKSNALSTHELFRPAKAAATHPKPWQPRSWERGIDNRQLRKVRTDAQIAQVQIINLRLADPAQPLRSRKRRALDSTPRIYNDSDGPSKTRTSQDVGSPMDLDDWPHTEPGTTRPVATRNVLSKRTVQNNRAIVNSNDGSGIVPLSKAVAGV